MQYPQTANVYTYVISCQHLRAHKITLCCIMNSTEVQNPRRKMQVALFAEPKTPLESSMSIINPRRACAARVTVVALCVCVCVCLCVCVSRPLICDSRN